MDHGAAGVRSSAIVGWDSEITVGGGGAWCFWRGLDPGVIAGATGEGRENSRPRFGGAPDLEPRLLDSGIPRRPFDVLFCT